MTISYKGLRHNSGNEIISRSSNRLAELGSKSGTTTSTEGRRRGEEVAEIQGGVSTCDILKHVHRIKRLAVIPSGVDKDYITNELPSVVKHCFRWVGVMIKRHNIA